MKKAEKLHCSPRCCDQNQERLQFRPAGTQTRFHRPMILQLATAENARIENNSRDLSLCPTVCTMVRTAETLYRQGQKALHVQGTQKQKQDDGLTLWLNGHTCTFLTVSTGVCSLMLSSSFTPAGSSSSWPNWGRRTPQLKLSVLSPLEHRKLALHKFPPNRAYFYAFALVLQKIKVFEHPEFGGSIISSRSATHVVVSCGNLFSAGCHARLPLN